MITITITDLATENKNVLRNFAALLKSFAETDDISLQSIGRKSHNENFTKEEIDESKNWAVTPECVKSDEINWDASKNIEIKNNPELLQQEYSGELDSEGTPWNPQIHSRTKSKNKDGTWRTKRGIQEETVQAITEKYQPQIPVPPIATAVPTPPQSTFTQIVKKISHALSHNQITRERVNEIIEIFGLSSLHQLSERPELIPAVEQQLNEIINNV